MTVTAKLLSTEPSLYGNNNSDAGNMAIVIPPSAQPAGEATSCLQRVKSAFVTTVFVFGIISIIFLSNATGKCMTSNSESETFCKSVRIANTCTHVIGFVGVIAALLK